MSHPAVACVKAALDCHQKEFGKDESEMLLATEVVSVDDALWVKVHSFETDSHRWFVTYPLVPGDMWKARLADEDDLENTDLDEWRA